MPSEEEEEEEEEEEDEDEDKNMEDMTSNHFDYYLL